MTNQRLVTWSCPNCDNYHNWIWDKWDIYESEIDMECDKCGKTTQMEMKVSPLTGNADAVPIVKQENKEPKKITLELTLEELKLIDKYVELNDETSEIFDKIRDAYPKPKTLTDIIWNWWEDVFTTHSDWDMETSIENLVDEISLWLPTEHETNSHKWNECIRMIREKLR